MKQLIIKVNINDDKSINLSQEQKNQIKSFYNKITSEQKDTTPEFEKTFIKNIRKLFVKL